MGLFETLPHAHLIPAQTIWLMLAPFDACFRNAFSPPGAAPQYVKANSLLRYYCLVTKAFLYVFLLKIYQHCIQEIRVLFNWHAYEVASDSLRSCTSAEA